MIRVAEVVQEPAHSGQAVHVLSLVEHLDRAKFSLWVCYPAEDARTRARLAELGVAGVPLPMQRWINVGPAWSFYRLVRRERISIVHVHGPFAGLWARPAARLAGARVIYTPQTIRIRQKHLAPFYLAAERLLGRWTDCLISVCEADRRRLIEQGWLAGDRVVTIPNGIDPVWWEARRQDQVSARQQLGWPLDQPVVLQVGRLNEQKAPQHFVDVAALVARQRPEARFYLAGDGPLREALQAKIRAMGLENTVILLGHRSDVPLLLAASDVVTLTSLWEGLPYTLLEAGAMGRPAVCTAVNGSPEVVLDGETGYVVPPADVPAMAKAILALLADPQRAAAMGERASARVRQRFDVRSMAEAIGRLYEQIDSCFSEHTRC